MTHSTIGDTGMNSKASGRSALIIAAGILVCVAGPALAANDVDRALSETRSDDKDKPPSATPSMAVAQAPAAAVSSDDSAWGQTSFIGKIFIAFGGLLTLASAARMFMA